jgi:cytochrome c biogenesis protein
MSLVRVLRGGWRQLTSMRTALVLLFLLALAAIPGSVLPQRALGPEKVNEYLRVHPGAGPWLDRFQLFNVYSSIWFSAIYLLLFVSLVGCVVPRLRTHVTALLRKPPAAPQRLDRLPAHAVVSAGAVADAASSARRLGEVLRKRRFRVAVRETADGYAVSGEKGYVKESGNLLFHFALLGLLVGVAAGASFGWHGNRILVSGAEQGFCNSRQQYDEVQLGGRVDDADLPYFCVSLVDFQASFLDNGQPVSFRAQVDYETRDDGGRRRVAVNDPLRLGGANVYLLGHGYAPAVRYTDRTGRSQTQVVPFLPDDGTLTSLGVVSFPDANIGVVDPSAGHTGKAQVAFDGTYLPTAPDDPRVLVSAFPAERNPVLVLQPYVGDLGMDAGLPQSVYRINFAQVAKGLLTRVGDPLTLRPGQSARLADGSTVEFLGTRPWVAVSVRHDPGEEFVLAGAVLLVLGLLASLTGRRRRVFFRVTADGVRAGGLPRSDYPGFAAEFESIVRAASEGDGDGGTVRPATGGHDSGVPDGDAVLRR